MKVRDMRFEYMKTKMKEKIQKFWSDDGNRALVIGGSVIFLAGMRFGKWTCRNDWWNGYFDYEKALSEYAIKCRKISKIVDGGKIICEFVKDS